MKFQRPVTPAEIGGSLTSLCAEISPGVTPVYIDVRPAAGYPANECFQLVESHVAAFGGAIIFGWSIWELPTIFVEAEFHAVWRSPEGDLIDIAPKAFATQRILFLQDELTRYQGRQIDNIRRAVSHDPIVEDYLSAFADSFEFMNRGERAHKHGAIQLTDGEAAEYAHIQQKIAMLQLDLLKRFPSFGPYTPCWCGSGKKVRWCHGVKSL